MVMIQTDMIKWLGARPQKIFGSPSTPILKYSSVVGLTIQLQLCTVQKQSSFIPNKNMYCYQPF